MLASLRKVVIYSSISGDDLSYFRLLVSDRNPFMPIPSASNEAAIRVFRAQGDLAIDDLAVQAGLRMSEMQRMWFGFHEDEAALWQAMAAVFKVYAVRRHAETRDKGELLPEWSNPDGGHSRTFKMQLKWEVMEEMDVRVRAQTGGEMHVMPIMARWTGVLTQ